MPDIPDMEQKEFIKILQRYRQGRATPAEKRLVDAWYLAMGKEDIGEHLPDESELLAHFEPIIENHIRKRKQRHIRPWHTVGIAASLLFAIVSYFFLSNRFAPKNWTSPEKEIQSVSWNQIENNSGIIQRILLCDSSVVLLEPKSQLRYPTLFPSSERAVYLEGQAFFEVSHDAQRPFFVYANEVTTKVLGTSFMIKALPGDQEITVAVRTGRVSVFTKNESANTRQQGNIILTPNQQIVYDRAEEKISRMIVDSPLPLVSDEEIKHIKFEAASVSEIFKAIEWVYGIDLVFDEEKFSACELSTTITEDGLYKKLDIICQAVGSEYKLEGNQILIVGTGCK